MAWGEGTSEEGIGLYLAFIAFLFVGAILSSCGEEFEEFPEHRTETEALD